MNADEAREKALAAQAEIPALFLVDVYDEIDRACKLGYAHTFKPLYHYITDCMKEEILRELSNRGYGVSCEGRQIRISWE